MKIYLVRHGEALCPQVDPQCPLSSKGLEQIETLGAFLTAQGLRPSMILHSQQCRARQTAQILSRHLDPHPQLEQHAQLNPSDPIDPILNRLEDESMIVGHLPYLQKLSGYLVARDRDLAIVRFVPATVLCLQQFDGHFTIDWAIGTNLIS